MRLFRLRPVIVQAVQVTGTNHAELHQFCGEHAYSRSVLAAHAAPASAQRDGRIGHVWSEAYNVWLGVQVGDWVERGAHGHLDVVRPHHMATRYSPLVGPSVDHEPLAGRPR